MFPELLAHLVLWSFKISEKNNLFKEKILRPTTMLIFKATVHAYKKNGIKGWNKFYIPFWEACGRVRSEYVRKTMSIDTNSARSIGSYHDYEDPLLGIDGHWQEEGKHKAVRIETHCPYGDYLHDVDCPDVCRILLCRFEEETAKPMNPNYYLDPLEKIIARGDDACVFVHRLKQ